MKTIIITTIPSPYRIPLFNRISRHLSERGIKLTVLFLSEGYSRRKWSVDKSEWQFDHIVLNDPAYTKGESFSSAAWSLPKILTQLKPDIVVVGGFSLASLWASIYCFLKNKKLMIWSGETLEEAERRSWKFARNIFRRFIVKLTSGYVAYGKAAQKYLLSLGVDNKLITISTNTVDTSFFSKPSAHTTYETIHPIRFTFVGHLDRRKGILELLTAFTHLNSQYSGKTELHIIGSGTLEQRINTFITESRLTNVYLHGFQQKEFIRDFLHSSDIVIFPSLEELYGLVPIEAMACSNAVLISKYAGISYEFDAVAHQKMLIDPKNIKQMVSAMLDLANDPELLKNHQILSQDLINVKFNIDHSALHFANGIYKQTRAEAS